MLLSKKGSPKTSSVCTAGLQRQLCTVLFEQNTTPAFMSGSVGRVEVNIVLDVLLMEPSSWTRTPKPVSHQQSRDSSRARLVQAARSSGTQSSLVLRDIDNGCVTRHWTIRNRAGEKQRKDLPRFFVKVDQVALREGLDMARTLQSLPNRKWRESVVPLQDVGLMKGSDQLDRAVLTTSRRRKVGKSDCNLGYDWAEQRWRVTARRLRIGFLRS